MRGERPSELTRRERDVLHLVRVGLTNEEIAARLGISPDTAKFHVSQILAKLGVSSREEAAELASRTRRGRRVLSIAWRAALTTTAILALGMLAVLAWSLRPNDASAPFEATIDDHLVYLLGPSSIDVVDPSLQKVIHTIETGYDPEIALAQDGSAVYLTDVSGSGDRWSVIDAKTWQTVAEQQISDRIDNIGVGSTGMAISADGRFVYVHKWEAMEGRYEGPLGSYPRSQHWWNVFDTATGHVLENAPQVSDCGIGQVFPPANHSQKFAVLCYQMQALVFVDTPSGSISGTVDIPGVASLCGQAYRQMAEAAQRPDGRIYLVTTDGCILDIDPGTGSATHVLSFDVPPVPALYALGEEVPGKVLHRMVSLSPDGESLIVGVGRGLSSEDYASSAQVVDLKSRKVVSSVPLDPSAWSLAQSPDGRILYVVNYESGLKAIDVGSGEVAWQAEVRSPWLVRTAPRP